MLIPALITLVAIAAATFAYARFVEPAWLRVRHRTLHVDGWRASGQARSLRILHLSDLHVGRSTQRLTRFIARAADIPADVVVITGDFVDLPDNVPELAAVLRPLIDGGRPVIGVLGNHDRYVYRHNRPRSKSDPYNAAPLIAAIQEAGVQLLVDDCVNVHTPSGAITIAGVDIRSHNAEGVASTLDGLDLAKTVLLAHSPDIFGHAQSAGTKLVLTGHTHGGQVRLGPWITPTTSTTNPLKPPSGVHAQGKTVMHVSPGLGTTMFTLRLFSRPEATVLEILPSAP